MEQINSKQADICQRAEYLMYRNRMIIDALDNWMPTEEANANLMREIIERNRKTNHGPTHNRQMNHGQSHLRQTHHGQTPTDPSPSLLPFGKRHIDRFKGTLRGTKQSSLWRLLLDCFVPRNDGNNNNPLSTKKINNFF